MLKSGNIPCSEKYNRSLIVIEKESFAITSLEIRTGLTNNLKFLFQLDSEGSRSGSSLSLRAMAPGVGGGTGQPAPSPAHTGGGQGHRGVQRSISATSSNNKPRRGSTGADNTCELMRGAGGDGEGGQGRSWLLVVCLYRPWHTEVSGYGCVI